MTNTNIQTFSSCPPRDVAVRQGRNDLEVEILRGDVYFDAYLHDVTVGDVFHVTEKYHRSEERWFRCLSPIKRSAGLGDCMSMVEVDPVFSFNGLEILQAAPTAPRRVPLGEPERKALAAPMDVTDVEFRDSK